MDQHAARLLLDGEWVAPAHRNRIVVMDPSSALQIGTVVSGDERDVDRAVHSARHALARWTATSPADRVGLVAAGARGLRMREEELARLVSAESGTSVARCRVSHVDTSVALLESLCADASALTWRDARRDSVVLREASGVVGVITPCAQPLAEIVGIVGAALLAGCTVVLKPSRLAPLSALLVAKIFQDAGLPAGVLNVVTGHGSVVGEALVGHPGVDVVAFTGSREVGRRVAVLATRSDKGAVLRVGGGTATIVLDGADVGAAVQAVTKECLDRWERGSFRSERLIVPGGMVATVEATVAALLGRPDTAVAPLRTRGQQVAALELLEWAHKEGARVVVTGAAVPEGGYFVPLTVLSEVELSMDVCRYELSGPVLCILSHNGADDAIRIANATLDGVAYDVWAGDDGEALEVAGALRSRAVRVNGANQRRTGQVDALIPRVTPSLFCQLKTVALPAV